MDNLFYAKMCMRVLSTSADKWPCKTGAVDGHAMGAPPMCMQGRSWYIYWVSATYLWENGMDTQRPSMSIEVLQLWQLQHRLPIAHARQKDQLHLAEQLHPPRLNSKQRVFTRIIFVISVVVSMYIIYKYICDFQQLSIMLCDAGILQRWVYRLLRSLLTSHTGKT